MKNLTKREFKKLLIRIATDGLIDLDKIQLLSSDERVDIVHHLVRRQLAIVKQLIPDDFDRDWLYCMGYCYEKSNGVFDFVCTSEHNIRPAAVKQCSIEKPLCPTGPNSDHANENTPERNHYLQIGLGNKKHCDMKNRIGYLFAECPECNALRYEDLAL